MEPVLLFVAAGLAAGFLSGLLGIGGALASTQLSGLVWRGGQDAHRDDLIERRL